MQHQNNYKKLQVSVCFEGVIWDNIREFTQIIDTLYYRENDEIR